MENHKSMRIEDHPQKTIIAIIGGGISGISVAVHLIRALATHQESSKSSVSIQLFEKSDEVGTGFAYDTKQNQAFLLNSTNLRIRISYEEDGDLLKWMIANREKYGDEFPMIKQDVIADFIPRKLAGLYLKERAEKIFEEAKLAGVCYEVIKKEVIDMDIGGDKQIMVKTSDGEIYLANYISLCTGNFENNKYSELTQYPGYFPFFYKREQEILRAIDKAQSVLIIGTSLSGIDCTLMLAENYFKGQITMASRDGVFPTIRRQLDFYEKKYFNKNRLIQMQESGKRITLDDFINDLNKTLSEEVFDKEVTIEEYAAGGCTEEQYNKLQQEYDMVLQGDAKWDQIVVVLQDTIDIYWRNFTEEEKEIFLRKYQSHLWKLLGSMPYHNVPHLIRLFETKQLQIQAGIKSLIYDESKKKFVAKYDFKGVQSECEYDFVLNAAGLNYDIRNASELYRNITKKQLLQFNRYGSLDCEINGQVKSHVSENIYTVGLSTFGTYYLPNLFSGIINQSILITQSIISKIQEQELSSSIKQ